MGNGKRAGGKVHRGRPKRVAKNGGKEGEAKKWELDPLEMKSGNLYSKLDKQISTAKQSTAQS
jgi:hypothetical protein